MLDTITQLTADVLKVPIALVSLVDRDRVWFKARHGFEPAEIPRRDSLCELGVAGRTSLAIPDATREPATMSNPYVTGAFSLRLYASVPLLTPEGFNLGCLCVADFAARPLEEADLQILEKMAGLVLDRIETLHSEHENRARQAQLALMQEKTDLALDAGTIGLWEISRCGERVTWNPGMHRIYGLKTGAFEGTREQWRAMVHPGDAARVRREWDVTFTLKETRFRSQYRIIRPDGEIRHICSYATMSEDAESSFSAVGVNVDITEQYLRLSSHLRGQQKFGSSRRSSASDDFQE